MGVKPFRIFSVYQMPSLQRNVSYSQNTTSNACDAKTNLKLREIEGREAQN